MIYVLFHYTTWQLSARTAELNGWDWHLLWLESCIHISSMGRGQLFWFWPYLRKKSGVKYHSAVRTKPPCWFQDTETFWTESSRNAAFGPWELDGYIQSIFKNSSFNCVWIFSKFYLTWISEFSEKYNFFFTLYFSGHVYMTGASRCVKKWWEKSALSKSWSVLSTCCTEERFAFSIARASQEVGSSQSLLAPTCGCISCSQSLLKTSSLEFSLCHHPNIIKYHSTDSVNRGWTHQNQCSPEGS